MKFIVWCDTLQGYALLSVKGRTEWKTKRTAQKHSREWKAANLRDSWIEGIY